MSSTMLNALSLEILLLVLCPAVGLTVARGQLGSEQTRFVRFLIHISLSLRRPLSLCRYNTPLVHPLGLSPISGMCL